MSEDQANTPGDVTNVVANDTTDTVTFSLDAAYSQYWFTYNELSQITPLPIALGHHLGRRSSRARGAVRARRTRRVVAPISATTGAARKTSHRPRKLVPPCTRSQWKDRIGRPRHLRHESALADRRRAVSPHLLRHDHYGAYTLMPNKVYSGPPKPLIDRLVIRAVHDHTRPSSMR